MTEFIKYLNMKMDARNDTIYFISDETGKRELYKNNMETGVTFKVTDESRHVKNYWLHDDGILIATDFNGNEREQLTLLTEEESVTIAKKRDYYHHYGVYSLNQYIYIRNHKDESHFELVANNGEERVIASFDAPVKILKKLSDIEILLTEDVSNIDKKVLIYNLSNNTLSEVPLPEGRIAHYNSTGEGSAVFVSDYDDGYLNLYSLDESTFEFNRVTYFKWNIEHLIVSEDKNTLYFTVNKQGCSKLFEYQLEEDILTPLDFTESGVVHSMELHAGHLYMLFSGPGAPHAFYVYDLNMMTTDKIFGNDIIPTDITVKVHTYPSFDNLDVPYFLYEQEDKDAPTVIHVHGGPESQARPEFNELYYRLYREGYQVAVPNIRGSTGYSKFYVGLDDREKRLDALEDVVYLRQHLIDRHAASFDSMFIMGRSYGGFMTLLAITHYPELWSGAVDIVGISHLKTLLEDTPPWRRRQRSFEYGFPGEHDEFFEAIAPYNKSADIAVPLRVFHSTNDVRVPYSESVQLYDKMKADGQDVDLVVYDNEGHQYLNTGNIDDLNDTVIKFFNEMS